jgi:superfamily I DNA/RNA helicase
MTLTNEQNIFIETVTQGKNILCDAIAGSAKSSTVIFSMEENPNTKFLYLVFTNAGLDDFRKKTNHLKNVESMTLHALAKRQTAADIKLSIYLKEILGLFDGDWNKTKKILNKFKKECKDTNELSKSSLKIAKWLDNQGKKTFDYLVYSYTKSLKMGHLLNNYDYVVIDEFNDQSPILVEFLNKLSNKKIVIGDKGQRIYSFMNLNKNPFELLDKSEFVELQLSKSFRCANYLSKDINSYIHSWNINSIDFNGFEYKTEKTKPRSFLCLTRTNGEIIEYILELIERDMKFQLKDKIEKIFLPMLNVYNHFSKSEKINYDEVIYNYGIYKSKNIDDFKYWCRENDTDNIYILACSFLEQIPYIYHRALELESKNAILKIMTAHSSKGLTADSVLMYSDDLDIVNICRENILKLDDNNKHNIEYQKLSINDKIDLLLENEDFVSELRLVYVAYTRARFSVKCKDGVAFKLHTKNEVIEMLQKEK